MKRAPSTRAGGPSNRSSVFPAAEPAARFGLGRIAAASGRQEDAIASFERAIALYPEWGAAHYALALSLRAVGRREDAQRAMKATRATGRAGHRSPIQCCLPFSICGMMPPSMLRRADALAESGDLQAAIAANEAALRRDPSLTVAHERLLTPLRPDQGLGQRRTALQGRDADRIQPGRHPGRLRCAPPDAGQMGSCRVGVPKRVRDQSAPRTGAQQSGTDPGTDAQLRGGGRAVSACGGEPADLPACTLQSRPRAHRAWPPGRSRCRTLAHHRAS